MLERPLAQNLLGQPNRHMSSHHELRFGSKGHLALQIKGEKQGLWYDFASGEGGNLFGLIQREQGCEFKHALDYVRQWVPQNVPALPLKQTEFQKDTVSQSATTCEKTQRIEDLYERSHRIEGTLAERYLQEHRGIRDGVLSPDLRFPVVL